VFLFPVCLPTSDFNNDRGDYRLFFSAKGARKGICKFQLQRTNPEIFAAHPLFYGDKLFIHAATSAFQQSLV
jgi:hypothetical protein